MLRTLVVMIGLLFAADAHALDPYMWGIGPRIGTRMIPGRYPLKFPDEIPDDTELERVRHDLIAGVQGAFYTGSWSRVDLLLGGSIGKGFLEGDVMLSWSYVAHAGAMDFLFGAAIGAGNYRFKGGDEVLNIPNYPMRLHTKIMARDRVRAYEFTIFTQYSIPSNHHYKIDDVMQDPDPSGGLYWCLGIELAVMFGDFTPPRERKDD